MTDRKDDYWCGEMVDAKSDTLIDRLAFGVAVKEKLQEHKSSMSKHDLS